MPRNNQGLYSLPPSNPVVPGTVIESEWANTTCGDIAEALTASLPRDGSAPMTGNITLPNSITNYGLRHAVSRAYVDKFVATSTGMPIGIIFPYGGPDKPGGCLLCDGQAVKRADYPQLFTIIGTVYGDGDGATTFNLPDLRGMFLRGLDPANRILGSKQEDAIKSHDHLITDPGHIHTSPTHTHTVSHNHTVTDPGHSHTYVRDMNGGSQGGTNRQRLEDQSATTSSNQTGISVDTAAPVSSGTSAVIDNGKVGITINKTGEDETRPKNIALNYWIKAIHDAQAPTGVIGLSSSDTQVLGIDDTDIQYPVLVPRTNTAFGLLKLDASGQVPVSNLPTGPQTFMGPFDCSGGQNPTQKYPTVTFGNGSTYLIVSQGTCDVYDPITHMHGATVCPSGASLVYVKTAGVPEGWYLITQSAATVVAAQVQFTPSGNLGASNVQAAITEVASDAVNDAIAMAIALG